LISPVNVRHEKVVVAASVEAEAGAEDIVVTVVAGVASEVGAKPQRG
jgi:hypothetical protein